MIRGVALAKVGVPRIRNCQMALTYRCNHKCSFCSSSDFVRKGGEMTLENWFSVVNQLKQLGCTHFDITGGEPSLWSEVDLCNLIFYINRKRDCVVSLATNGKIIDKHWLRKMHECGLTVIEYDLQAADADVHNKRVVSKDNFQKIMVLIDEAHEIGLKVCINTCFAEDNHDDIIRLMDWCDEKKIHCLLNLGAPTGRSANKDVRLKSEKDYYRALYAHPYSRSDTSYNYRGLNLCPGGVEKLYITPYGDVIQCTFCQISYGNVLKEPLSLIYRRFLSNPDITKKSICKHTFDPEFRKKWIDPIEGRKDLPIPLYEHPSYQEVLPTPEKYKEALGFLFNHLIWKKARIVMKHTGGMSRGYDIGAGFGQYARALASRGYGIIAVEPDGNFSKHDTKIKTMLGESIDEKADFAYIINVLHHAKDPVGLLKHVKTKVKRVIISELNRKNPVVRKYIRWKMKWENPSTHYSTKELEDVIKYSGLKIVKKFSQSLLGIPKTYHWYICE